MHTHTMHAHTMHTHTMHAHTMHAHTMYAHTMHTTTNKCFVYHSMHVCTNSYNGLVKCCLSLLVYHTWQIKLTSSIAA